MARSGKRRGPASRGGVLAWALGAAAMGVGAGVAIERLAIGRARLRPDPHAGVPYGALAGDRRYRVSSFDGAVLLVEEAGPERATSGAVLLHGFCLDRTIWHHQVQEIDGRRRLVYYDARHHGLSRHGDQASDTKTLAADLEAVLDRSRLRSAVLVGHSMGGMTALEYCRQNPGELGKRVRGLVLLNTTYTDALKTIFAAGAVAPVERRLRTLINRLLDDPRSARALRLRGDDLSWLLVKAFGFGPKASPTQVEYVQRLLNSFPSPPLVETMRGLRDFDIQEALQAINVPTLVIAGGDDRVTTVRASRRIAEEIPGARLVVFEKAGHMSMMERHSELNSLLSEFLEKVLPRPRSRRAASGAGG